HVDVVHDGAELIGRQGGSAARASSGAKENEVLDLVVLDFARTENRVVETGGRTERHAETHCRLLVGAGRLAVAATAANHTPYFDFAAGDFVSSIGARVFLGRTKA